MKIGKYIDGLYGIDSNIDLIQLRKDSLVMYDAIKEIFGHSEDFDGNSTLTTQLYSDYNLLLYPFAIFHDLYFEIQKAFHLALDDYTGRKVNDNFFIQCWLNVYRKGQYINWHSHHKPSYNSWHGFLCVDTEPESYTSYRWPNDITRKDLILDIPSKDGLIVMGLSNDDVHRSSEWIFEDRPRITIAFDILPTSAFEKEIYPLPEPRYLNAMKRTPYFVNHWIPI